MVSKQEEDHEELGLTDDLKDWTELRNYSELKRTAEDRTIWNTLARQPFT